MIKLKAFSLTTALLLASFVSLGVADTSQELAIFNQEPLSYQNETSDPRELGSTRFFMSWSSFKSDSKYSSYWSWYAEFESTNIKRTSCRSNELDFRKTKVSKKLVVEIIKRKACLRSQSVSIPQDITKCWADVWTGWAKNELSVIVKGGYIKAKDDDDDKDDYEDDDYDDDYESDKNNCKDGQYLNAKKKCSYCPIGCNTCNSQNVCSTCQKGFTLVKTPTNSTCVADCPVGKYLQTQYTQQSSKKKSKTPIMYSLECKDCPIGCEDCVYNSSSSKPVCYECKKGFNFNRATGGCSLNSTCDSGEYRKVAVTSKSVVNSSNIQDFICRQCVNGCNNCTSGSNCNKCRDFWVMAPGQSKSANNATCAPCPAFCQNCSYNSTTKGSVCLQCQNPFYLINNGQKCQINRTCANGQWFNDTKLSCSACPDKCTSCVQGSRNGTVNCTSCTVEAKPDSKSGQCVDKCNTLVEYYDKKDNSCLTCANGTFPSFSTQSCKKCTKNCDICGLTWVVDKYNSGGSQSNAFVWTYARNTSNGYIYISINLTSASVKYQSISSGHVKDEEDCYVCSNNTYYDASQKKCRTDCNITSYFNFTQMQCVNCKVGEFVDRKTGQCKACPKNCTTCVQSPNSDTPVCQSCISKFVVDFTRQDCRPTCTNASHTFDYSSYSCKPCPSSSIINSTTRLCDKCPTGCGTCYRNDSAASNVSCKKCNVFYTLDTNRNQCRLTCYGTQKYYWETESCRDCPPYQSISYETKNCTPCEYGCIDCFKRSAGRKPMCINCGDDFQFDITTLQCKKSCDNNTFYSYSTNQCQWCPSGKYYDSVWNNCYNCTVANCGNCTKNGTFSSQCNTCKEGYFLDQYGNCKGGCGDNSYFDKVRNSCITCSARQFYNKTSTSCEACPFTCNTCKYSNGSTTCSNCSSGYILDSARQTCRAPCTSDKPFYNQTVGSCVSCPPRTFFENGQCNNCPANCSSCKRDNRTMKCDGCINSWILDETVLQCKPSCPDNQQYDWTLQKCTTCAAGKWLNSTNQNCQSCPTNCSSCTYFSTNNSYTCQSCFSPNVFEASRQKCRQNCSANQYYSWNSSSCVGCLSSQYLVYSTQTCKSCPTYCSSCVGNETSTECTACKSGATLDSSMKNCRLPCNSTSYYDWSLSKCVLCSGGLYKSPSSEQCQNCPSGCSNCQYNSAKSTAQCSSCQSGLILDSSKGLCRIACNSTSYYDWNFQACINCKDGTYMNSTTQTCTACPSRCTTCNLNNSTKKLECPSCASGSVRDTTTLTCREACNSTAMYDYNQSKCVQCSAGTYLNSNSGACEACTSGCTTCQAGPTGSTKPDCTSCLAGLTLDQYICRKTCTANQYYDWSVPDCKECPSGTVFSSQSNQCELCSSNCQQCSYDQSNNQICGTCTSPYLLDTQRNTCRAPCTSDKPLYNQTQGYCVACPSQTLFESQSCTPCPANCTSCSRDTSSGKLVCPNCLNNWLLDETMKQCKPSCPSNQQYDWTLQKCTSCSAGQWLNSTNQKCQSCPTNCSSCTYLSTSKSFTCESCFSPNINERSTCRIPCSSSQIYDWTTSSCVTCPSGAYINQTSQLCSACPTNCATCSMNSTGDVECQTCKSNRVYDSGMKNCKLSCNSTSYYDWNSNQCRQCNAGSYLNPSTGSCQQCPSGCASCSFNSGNSMVECQSCYSPMILDSSKNLCRVSCDYRSYYDWSLESCVNCGNTQYLNAQSTCQDCPSKCTQCELNSQKTAVECTACTSGNIVDGSLKSCRESCNSTAFYNYNTQQCTQCSSGTYLNQTSQVCESCTSGCVSCTASTQGPSYKPDCTQCSPALTLDKFQCRETCQINQYYDWSTLKCTSCSNGCMQCIDASTCQACDEQYDLVSGACSNKCQAGVTVWNSATKTCDSIRTFGITVSPNMTKNMRCRTATVTLAGSGFYSDESPIYGWSAQIISGGVYQSGWFPQLTTVLSDANTTNSQSILITREISEMVFDTTTIKFTVSMTVSGVTVTNTTQFIIEKAVYTTISNYSSSYSFYSSDGLFIYPVFNYPECPTQYGPSPIPSTVSIGCTLYDSKGNLIKSLLYCFVKSGDTTPGNTYTIKYAYTPNSYQTTLRDAISLTAIAQPPSCSILNATMFYVRTDDTLNLKVTVINSRTTFKYTWNCLPQSSGASCAVLSSTQNTADLSMPASSLTLNGVYNFSLSVIENSATQTTCSAFVEVVPTTPKPFTLTFLDNANSRNYIDPSLSQNVMCSQTQDTAAYVQYEWKLVKKSDNSILFNSVSLQNTNITASSNQLSILRSTLPVDTYDLTCFAYNLKYSSTLLKTYTTSLILTEYKITFSINPRTGTEQSTAYTLQATKPTGAALWCKFGYALNTGDQELTDNAPITYSSAAQSLSTQLSRPQDMTTQTMYAQCYDSTGAYVRQTNTVTVNPAVNALSGSISTLQSENFLNQEGAMKQITFSDIQVSFERITKMIADKYQQEFITGQADELIETIESYSTNLTVAELDIVIQMLTTIRELSTSNKFDGLISILLSPSELPKMDVLELDQYTKLIGLFKFANSIKSQQAVRIGALRSSGNIQANTEPKTIVSGNFKVSISKQTKDALHSKDSITIASVNVPYFKELHNYENTVLIAVESLSTESMILSREIVDISLYSIDSPISTNGKITAETVPVNGAIRLTLDLKQNKSDAVCSTMNQDSEWENLYCPLIFDSREDQLQCCSTEFGVFAAVSKDYFSSLEKSRSLQFVVSLIPSLLVLLLLVGGVIQLTYKKSVENVEFASPTVNKEIQQSEASMQFEDASSPTKLKSQVSMQYPRPVATVSQPEQNQVHSRLSKIETVFRIADNASPLCNLQRRLIVFNLWLVTFLLCGFLAMRLDSVYQIAVFASFLTQACEIILRCAGNQFEKAPVYFLRVWLALLGFALVAQVVLLSAKASRMPRNQFESQMLGGALSLLLTNIVPDFVIIPLTSRLVSKMRGGDSKSE